MSSRVLHFFEGEEEIEDPEEECFILFSSKPDNRNLGFVSRTETTVSVTVNSRDFTIHQSPSLLTSTRETGTTGAVLWKVTPLLASWLTHPSNPIIGNILNQSSSVIELGAGTSGVIALSLSPFVGQYYATDQEYCLKILRKNISENEKEIRKPASSRGKKGKGQTTGSSNTNKITVSPLDWQLTEVSSIPELKGKHIDLIIAADCIYNESLVDPLVNTMVDICNLNSEEETSDTTDLTKNRGNKATLVMVAQELRSPDVLETFMKAFCKRFRVWRVPDKFIKACGDDVKGLAEGGGFVVHIGVLR